MAPTTHSNVRASYRLDASRPGVIRARERDTLTEVLDAAEDGRGQALLVRGDAGLGTTTLLQQAILSAHAFRVATVSGVESEHDLSYAGLHRLCVTLLDGVDELPAPQREALAAAFGLQPGSTDPFLVGLAVLGLLTEMSESEPVLCIVDDFQWIDATSRQVLAFVARRIGTERVAVMFGARNSVDELAGVPELVLLGLSSADARELLASVVPGPLCAHVADRIVNEARGNPQALLTLLRGSSPEQLAGGFGVPLVLPSTDARVATLRSRLDGLAAETRNVLLVAAAEPEGDPALFWRAAELLGLGSRAVDDAVGLELLEFGTRVTFTQPEMRSVVYHDATPETRRQAHRALAEAIGPRADPDRRAWHRGQATADVDEEVADALERSATYAHARGGFAAAAAVLERSALITPRADRRARRALLAARAKYEAGSLDAAADLLAMVRDTSLDEVDRAQRERLRADLDLAQHRGSDTPPLLLGAAQALEQLDVQLARDTYLQTLEAALLAGRLRSHQEVVEAAVAGRAAPIATVPCAADLLLDGLVLLFTEGYVEAQPTLHRAVQAFRNDPDARWLGLACRAASEVWDIDAGFDLAMRWTQLNRDAGALTQLPMALNHLAGLHVHAGEFEAAARLIDEADALAQATGLDRSPSGALVLAAWRGCEARTIELIEACTRDALKRGDGRLLSTIGYSTAVLYNGVGRYRDAFDALQPAAEREELLSSWALPELVEAAARAGELALARSAAEKLTVRAQAAGTEWALAFEARSLALVTDGPPAEKLFREAVERFGRCQASAHLARAHLVYGEWLRRERRRVDAREQLHLAHDLFSNMGATAFSARAQRELIATGAHARKRNVETSRDLTPQELEIARLASGGSSNPEIAAQLFISARTVEYHLHKVFTKLDIRSRIQLPDALPLHSDAAAVARAGGGSR